MVRVHSLASGPILRLNQPIVRDYLRTIESNGYSYLFIDQFFNDLQDIYSPTGEVMSVTELPNEENLGKMVGVNVSDMKPIQKAQQQFILQEFVKYAKLAEHLFHVTQGSNFDTATINDPYLVFKKMMQLKKARNTMISSVDDVLDNSFVGALKDKIYDFRDAFATVLTSDKKAVRNVIEAVLTPFIELSDRDFVKVAQKAVNDMFDWAVQTDRKFNMQIEEILLGKDNVKSAAAQVMAFQKQVLADKKHPLFNNMIINSIREKPGQKEGAPNNLFLIDKYTKVYDQNLIIYSFRELKNHLGTEGNDLYKKLVRLAVIQSGLSNSPISFTSLLPYEDFKEEYNETLANLENIPNLAEFYTLNVFQRNNWSNSTIVGSSKAKWKKSKKGKWYSKPNAPSEMSFLDKKLKGAIGNGVIPQLLNFSTLSSEGRNEFIVFSWENGAYSKEQKKKMRSKGNYSYINKGLFQKVYDEDGKPLIQTSTDKEGNIYESFIYKAINAWGDSFRANEFYNIPTASKLENGFIKVENKSETVTIPGTNTTYQVVKSAEVEDSIIEQILNKDAVITKPQVIPTGVQTKTVQAPKAVSGPSSETKINIYAGTGENAELSNFAKRPFTLKDDDISFDMGDDFKRNFYSVEQAFQYMKSVIAGDSFKGSDKVSEKIANETNGAKLKALGGRGSLVTSKEGLEEWDRMSETFMYELLLASFKQNPQSLNELFATGNATLTHKYKGVEQDGGRFSKLLMKVREELRPTQSVNVTKSDAEIRATKEYQDWLKNNENPLMSEQENLEYYKVCKL